MTDSHGATLLSGTPESPSPTQTLERGRGRVIVTAPPAWVIMREVDEGYRAPGGGPDSILLLDRQRRFGEEAQFDRVVRRLETLQAVQEASQWRLDFDPATQTVEVHTLAVRRGSQVFEHARPERLRLLQREENLDRYVLDGRVSVVVLLEDVRVGDIIDTSFTIRTKPRLFRDRHWLFATVPWIVPIRAFHLRALFPGSMAMRWMSDRPEDGPAEQEIGAETEWSWSLENTTALEPEPGVPQGHFHGRWFQLSDFRSWGEVAAGLLSEWREDFNSSELEEMAEEISGRTASTHDRAEHAIRLVQDEIRYLSCNEEFGGHIPSPPGMVLQRRFGDCKDKSFLLAHLLRRLGIPARPVLVHSVWRKLLARFLPMPAAFDHAIIEYEIDGNRAWCDTTTPLQGGGALGRALPDFSLGLPISPDASELETIPSQDRVSAVLEVNETFHLDSAGRSSVLTLVVRATGGEADHLRRRFALEGAEAMARQRERFYQTFFPELKRTGEMEWQDDRDRNEVKIGATYDLPKPFTGETRRNEVVFRFRAHVVQSVLTLPSPGERKQPLELHFPCDFRQTIEIYSPAFVARPPERFRPPGGDFLYEVDVRAQAGRLSYDYSVRTTTDVIKAESYSEHSQIVQGLWRTTEIEIALPVGLPLPRRRKVEETVLPPLQGISRREESKELANESNPHLPSAPAAALTSRVVEKTIMPAQTHAAGRWRGERPESPREEPALAAPDPEPERRRAEISKAAPSATSGETSRARRARKRRRSSRPDRTWLFLLLVIGLAFVAVLVAMSMNKK